MTTQRPRLSVLSLFDPLSSTSLSRFVSSTDFDKENDCNDDSFFHFHGSQKQVYSPVRKLCRRLIDVGDATVDEPDIKDLLQEEEELDAEIKQSFAVEEDENATLTFRDMAKAATPKWSAQRAATWASPKMSPTPRTPLAEIAPKDEITPMGRKKTFRRQMPFVSKAHQTNVVTSSDATPPAFRNSINVQECSTSLAMPVPTIEISCDTETTNSQCSSKTSEETTAALESSRSTLPSDTSAFVSPFSLQPTPESAVDTSPQSFESRLRPNAYLKDSNNSDRHSVDLHSSFQLHFNPSEATFDLLNDKISFFGSNSGMNFCEGTSFDDDGFGPTYHEPVNDACAGGQEALSLKGPIEVHGFGTPNEKRFESQEGQHASILDAICNGIKDRTTSKIATPPAPVCKKSSISNGINEFPIPLPSSIEPASDMVSTPNSRPTALAPPRPVAALKVIKRAKTVDQAKVAGSRINPGGSRRTSSVTTINVPASQVPAQSSPEKVSSLTCKVTENSQGSGRVRRAVNKGPVIPSGSQSGDGPRRILVNDGPKLKPPLNTKGQTNPTQVTLGGPRRIPASESGNTTRPPRSTLNIVNPARCATIGSFAAGSTAIPRPVNRNSGSKIPAPSGGKQRFGVQMEPGGPNKGLLGRRAT